MKYLEIQDSNDLPIFEGDQLLITIKDKFWGASYFGKFCSFFNIDTAIITILENESFLEIKYEIRFFHDNTQIVTNLEESFWSYIDNCNENKTEPTKTLNDMENIESPNDFYVLKSSKSSFFSYITGKGVVKQSGYDGEAIKAKDEDLIIKSDLNFPLYLNDAILVELNEEWKSKFEKQVDSLNLIKNDFNYLRFNITRKKDSFGYKISVYPVNIDGECQVFKDVLNSEAHKDYEFFFGFDNEINVLNSFFKRGLKIFKIHNQVY